MVDNESENVHSVFFYFFVWFCAGLVGGLAGFFCWGLGLILAGVYGGYVFDKQWQ
jgi:hypothetical protein